MMLITSLSDETIVQQVYWWSEYDSAKTNIIARFSDGVSDEISDLFTEFEQAQWNKEEMKIILDNVYKVAAREEQAWTIDTVDLAYVKKNLCDVIIYYELPSVSCGTAVDATDPTIPRTSWGTDGSSWDADDSAAWWISKKILRIVIIVVVILAVIFGILVVLFAIKAKRQKEYDEYDDDDEYEEDLSEDVVDVPADKEE